MMTFSEQFAWQGYAMAKVAWAFPFDWEEQVRQTVQTSAIPVQRKGGGPGSLEPEEQAGLDYRVVDGLGVRKYLGWLDRWYRGHAVALASFAFGWEVFPAREERSALNINCLQGPGRRYELHTDSAHSALLFVTALGEGDGGELFLAPPGHPPVRIRPLSGQMVFFDGSVTPHAVMPLLTAKERISIPLAFTSDRIMARAPSLDSYLFGTGEEEK